MVSLLVALGTSILLQQTPEQELRPDAGADRTVGMGQFVQLEGELRGRSPLEWWVSDGNGATEDMVVCYHSEDGVTAFGPLRDTAGMVYHSPMDFEFIRGRLFGSDVNRDRFYIADTESGIVTPVGPLREHGIQGLAYDRMNGRLFGLEMRGDLYEINFANGAMRLIGRLEIPGAKPHFFSLAYDAASGRLYSVDQKGHRLVWIDPNTAELEIIGPIGDDVLWIDELTFHRGVMYASISVIVDGHMDHAQLVRVNKFNARTTRVGPIIDGVSPHAMVILSVPEPAEWTVASAPAQVSFSDSTALDPVVTFSAPGRYELVLNALGRHGPVSDSVVIDVMLNPDEE